MRHQRFDVLFLYICSSIVIGNYSHLFTSFCAWNTYLGYAQGVWVGGMQVTQHVDSYWKTSVSPSTIYRRS